MNTPEQGQALGFHNRHVGGIPFGFVFTELARQLGDPGAEVGRLVVPARRHLRRRGARGIVLAVAGNELPWVVYPAVFDEVVPVAASNVDDRPWKDSASGGAMSRRRGSRSGGGGRYGAMA